MNPPTQKKSSSAVSATGKTLWITSILRGNTSTTRTSSPLTHRCSPRETAHKAVPFTPFGDTRRFQPSGIVIRECVYKSPLGPPSLGSIFRQLILKLNLPETITNQPFEVFKTKFSNSAKMQFSAATLAFFVNLALSAAVPDAAPLGMVQKLDARDVSENLIFGRSFPCASNDPTTCCAVSHLYAVPSLHHRQSQLPFTMGMYTQDHMVPY